MQEINNNIIKHNEHLPRKNHKRRRKPEQVFKAERIQRSAKKGGLDFVWYKDVAYDQHLFPFLRQLRKDYPNRRIFVSEDNVGVHHKARKMRARQIKELEKEQIFFLDWPMNSPDLHPIETLHNEEKSILTQYKVTSGSKKAKQDAKEYLRMLWQEDPVFNKIMMEKASNSEYYRRIQLAKSHGFENNFDA
jgi:hypothetical protein